MIDKYYEKARRQIRNNTIEEAINTLIAGLDRGYAKCAFGVIDAVINYGSYLMTDDEAISIFKSTYPDIKLLAEEGDAEAMVMVAQGIQYGFVEDEDEPYMFWLNKAREIDDVQVIKMLDEMDVADDLLWVSGEAQELHTDSHKSVGGIDLLLLDDQPELEDELEVPEDQVLLADADWEVREQVGLNSYCKGKEREQEMLIMNGKDNDRDDKNR